MRAAELTTGAIIGSVRTSAGAPVPDARVLAVSPSGRYAATSDAKGTFVILGVVPDTYTIIAQAKGYEVATQVWTILPGEREEVAFTLKVQLKEIAHVEAKGEAFSVGSTSDVFTVSGEQARATSPSESASGLANYTQGTVQGALNGVPGVQFDSFANAIVRGGKVQDTVFDYDSVPVPQGLIAEPGGNIIGAQLGTTGVAATTLTLAGYSDVSQNALGGVVNEIPAIGTYPAQGSFEIADGIGAQMSEEKASQQWATPDLRWRYSLAETAGTAYFRYGDGSTFYPSEMGTYGLALQTRAQSAWSGNVHFQPNQQNDFSATFLSGVATYAQYDTPYEGEVWANFNGKSSSFPGQPQNPDSQVGTPSLGRGTYFVGKLQWLHNWRHSLGRVYVYRSQIGATANGPFWDDLSFPDGVISLWSQQWQRQDGVGFDYEDQAGAKNDLRGGIQYSVTTSYLDQIVPTADEVITSNSRLNQELLYLSDTWSIGDRLMASGTVRYITQNVLTGAGFSYGDDAIDPHLGLAYTLGGENALRATFDHTSVAPLPLEVQRSDSTAPAPPVLLSPETADDYALSYEHGGPVQVRLTYYLQFEKNVIDVLPFNYRGITSENPSAVGVPTNAGMLRSHGVELFVKHGGLTFNAMYDRTFTSSVTQFAYNDLNPAAILAGHLYPAGYIPDLTATLEYEFELFHRRLRITPMLSYESGYPYGNGTMVWITNPKTGAPELVPNDNYVNPGYNYYFLKNPALPYNASSNRYIGSLGTSEGADPNTLRTMPQTLASLHAEYDLTRRMSAILDIVNLFGTDTPTQFQGNPYLIGPPEYNGGDIYYEKAYGAQYCKGCLYTLGNGIPTNNGKSQAAPWTYGTAGYVPGGYPMARSAQIRLRYRL
ncbi:MAG: TonB-dependent receptor [Candidatus Eremiobacteraeota bacterium]|nr:TonB-dependent receptor [Candidatus Eremiobacteraeota bacterium]